MLVSVTREEGSATMVTMVTERLQHQSLSDSHPKGCSKHLISTEQLNQTGCPYTYEVHGNSCSVAGGHTLPICNKPRVENPPFPVCPSSCLSNGLPEQQGEECGASPVGCIGGAAPVPGWTSPLNLGQVGRLAQAPPPKRHCRSLSEPSAWSPGCGSRVWTPVSRRHCPPPPAPSTSPAGPRPSSASSGFAEASSSSSSSSDGCCDCGPCRRLSLSQERASPCLLRCQSQPCVLQETKNSLKRRRGEDVRWSRPSLDFLKMTRFLKSSKSLCLLDCEEGGDTFLKATGASPPECDLAPSAGSSELRPAERSHSLLHLGRSFSTAVAVSESDEDTSDSESTEEAIFSLDCGDLDLDEIENN